MVCWPGGAIDVAEIQCPGIWRKFPRISLLRVILCLWLVNRLDARNRTRAMFSN